MAYFETKSGSLEESIRKAVGGIQEKKTEYVELEFKDKQAAINAFNTVNRKVYPGGMQPFSDINQEHFSTKHFPIQSLLSHPCSTKQHHLLK